jgi:hypothetical protein
MNPEKQRIAIAEACGYKRCVNQDGIGYAAEVWVKPGLPTVPYPDRLPGYLNDLNAMHEAELSLSFDQWMNFSNTLQQLTENDTESPAFNRGMSATAAQRAEAFLRTLNLWTE